MGLIPKVNNKYAPSWAGGSMNNLNSVLIEGNLVDIPELKEMSGCKLPSCFFKVKSYYRTQTSETNIIVEIKTDNMMAEKCYKDLEKDSSVRVIGRLSSDNNKIIIQAEHIEIK